METVFALGSLGVGLLLLAVALILRLWSTTRWPATDGVSGMAYAVDDARIGGAARAVLAGRPRRAAAAALGDLDARGAITIGRPEKDRNPEVRIRDIGLVDADAHLLLGAYGTVGSGRRSTIWEAIDTVSEALVREGLTGRIIRWPARLLIPIAVIAVILSALVIILVAPGATVWAAVAGTAAGVGAIVVVPTRIQRPTAAAEPLLVALGARREAVQRGAATSPAQDVMLFADTARLRATAVGPDGVTLHQLVRAADPGTRRGSIISTVFELLPW